MHHLRAKRRASPESSTLAVSSPSTGTQPTATTRDSRGKGRAKTTQNLLISALKITKELSSTCPPLREAVGALLIVLEAYKKYSDTIETIETLLSRIQPLNEILKKVGSGSDCPQALEKRLGTLASKLTEVVNAAEKVQSKRWIVQFINSADYTEKTESWIKMLDWHIRSFVASADQSSLSADSERPSQLEGTIMLELTVDQGFNMMNSRFDEVVERIHELRADLDILAHDDPLRKALRPVAEALWYSGSSVHVQCHENTRMEVLAMLRSWLQPDHPHLAQLPSPVLPALSNRSILWIHALAGSGKSTIALTVADCWEKAELLGASFFCARDGNRSNVNCIFRTLAYQLALRFPAFRDQLTKVLEKDPDLYSSHPTRQLEKLIVAPLRAARADVQSPNTFPTHVAVVIDALDECTDNDAVSIILKSLALYIGQLAPLKFLITSRPEENIARGFLLRNISENTQELALNKTPEDLRKRDISTFLRSRLAAIREDYFLDASWPTSQQLENLVDLSEHLFIFASLAARYIEDKVERDPQRRLASLLDVGNEAAENRGPSASPFQILDSLYIQVLRNVVPNNATPDHAGGTPEAVLKARLKLILGTIVLAEQRLSPSTLDALLGLQAGTVRRVLPVLSSILAIPDRREDLDPVDIIHLSFPNFLLDPTRCTDQSFLVRPHIQHSHIAFRCLKLMEALKYNILEVTSEHDCVLNSEIPDLLARISQHIPPALQYACKYWTRHLCEAEVGEELLTALEEFCKFRLLHWLEVLSLLGCVDGAVMALQSVQAFLNLLIRLRTLTPSLRATDVPSLLYDCERAVRAFYPIISISAMHMYSTIAIFAPLDTPIRRLAAANARTSLAVRVGLQNTWSDTLVSRVMEEQRIGALAFSPDGTYVACGQGVGTIRLLNAHTGTELRAFECHAKDLIRSLSFSPTGKELLSSSDNGAVDLWDVATGAKLYTWQAHSDSVNSVAWSLDGTLAASASDDNTVRLWRVASPETMVVLQHDASVSHVVFAPDGDLLSLSRDGSCKIWSTRGVDWGTEANIEPTQTLKHDSGADDPGVYTVAVSLDSRLVACGLDDGKIILWTKSDGQRVRSLPGHSMVISLAFYPSGLLAAAYQSSPFTLWDVSAGAPVKRAGREYASVAAFASDCVHIAHAVGRQFHVRLWPPELKQNATRTKAITRKLKQLARREPVGNRRTHLQAATISPTGKLVLAEYEDELRMYEVSTGRCMHTIDDFSNHYPPAIWSPTGRLFACARPDGVARVWKADSGEHVGTFRNCVGQDNGPGVVFTRDEQHVLFPTRDDTIRRGKIGARTSSEDLFQSVGDEFGALAVSSDGKWILSASHRHRSQSPPDTSSATLLAHPCRQPVVGENGYYRTLRLHDVTTGHVVWIEHHLQGIRSIAFSEDCTRALASNSRGEVFLYDLTQIIPPDPSVPRSPPPLAVPEHQLTVGETGRYIARISFSPDGRAVIADSTYTSIPSELQPLHTTSTDPSLPAMSFYDRDWLWHINHPHSDPDRLCWIPSMFRPFTDSIRHFSSASGQVIVYVTVEGSLLVMVRASTS
ncbi:hypothetical protein GY45DRAFT_1337561 [Cubamyces sp. BRFM 1775]|nr:hypothetical protein GY45DRAFT_1337561 [Cubamyces sp. BRFM 1775]